MLEAAIHWRPKRYFSGLCDRLRCLAAVVFLRNQLGIPNLVVYWPLNQSCPYSLSDLTFASGVVGYDSQPPTSFNYIKEFTYDANAWCDVFLKTDPQYFPNYSSFSKAVSQGLQILFTSSQYHHLYASWMQAQFISPVTIGVHLRRTDNIGPLGRIKTLSEKLHLDDILFNEVCLKLKSTNLNTIYLASDDYSYFLNWKSLFKQDCIQVLSFPKSYSPSNLRQTDATAIMCDIIGLSFCDAVYCSCPSSVLLVASRINSRPKILRVY